MRNTKKEFLKLEAEHKEEVKNIRLKWVVMGLASLKTEITEDVNSQNNNKDKNVKKQILKIYGGDDDPECCICMEKDKEAVFDPCGHYVCCYKCAEDIQHINMPCPICRQYFLKFELYSDVSNK